MPAGRPNRPLFDLIPGESPDARRRSAAATPAAVEVKPVLRSPSPAEKPEAPEPVSFRTAPRGFWGTLISSGRAQLEVNTAWVAATAVLVLGTILAAWVIAYKMAESQTTQRLAGGVSTAPPPALHGSPEPGTGRNRAGAIPPNDSDRPASEQAPDPTGPAGDVQTADKNQPGTAAPADGLPAANHNDSGAVVAYSGSYDTDPRTVGQNYLVLASGMTRQDARDAVDFLGRSGFSALGVPYKGVDRTGRDGKNDPLYKLVSAQGFDSGELKETQRQRDKIADEARRLGLTYQRQQHGKYNFAKVLWEKYVR